MTDADRMVAHGMGYESAVEATAGVASPGHEEARAERWAVKLFLSHWWQVAYESTYNKPAPTPYAIEHLGHVHTIPVPGWPMENAADKAV